jgi:hypothetical protein
MLVEFARRDIRPDLILFADTGGEKPETYRTWLSSVPSSLGPASLMWSWSVTGRSGGFGAFEYILSSS